MKELEVGDEIYIEYGPDAGRVGTIDGFHMKEISIKFNEEEGGTYRYDNIKPLN